MTIKFLDSKRIVALSTDEVKTLLYEDDFSSNNFDYTNANGKFSYSSGKLNFDITASSGTARAYKQLSSSLGSSDWELLYTVKFDSFNATGNTTGLSIGVASNNTGASNSYVTEYAFDGGGRYNYLIANAQGNYSAALFWNSGTEYFIRMKVTASTGKSDFVAYTSASDRSAEINPVANSTITKTPSTPPTTYMNYLVVANHRPTNGGSGDGYIKDITINRNTGTRWTTTITGSSTGAIADSVNGGYLITTGSTNNDRVEIDFGQKRQFSKIGSRFIIEATMGQTTDLISQLGFMDNVHASYANKAICGIWTAAASVKFLWQTTGTGTSTNTSSTLTTDTNPHTFEAVLTGSNFVGTIDGTITTTISTNLPDLDMQPHVDMINKGSASKTLNVRYFEAYNT